MRFVRLLGVVIIFYGLSYLQFGVKQLYDALNHGPSRPISWYVILTNFNIGLIIFVVGIGVLLAKEWARILWLMSSIALVAVHIALLALLYANGENQTQQFLNAVLIVILSLISWTKLTRQDVKELFR